LIHDPGEGIMLPTIDAGQGPFQNPFNVHTRIWSRSFNVTCLVMGSIVWRRLNLEDSVP
jgi:hypothetical protein